MALRSRYSTKALRKLGRMRDQKAEKEDGQYYGSDRVITWYFSFSSLNAAMFA
jgi:hypothetical protein